MRGAGLAEALAKRMAEVCPGEDWIVRAKDATRDPHIELILREKGRLCAFDLRPNSARILTFSVVSRIEILAFSQTAHEGIAEWLQEATDGKAHSPDLL